MYRFMFYQEERSIIHDWCLMGATSDKSFERWAQFSVRGVNKGLKPASVMVFNPHSPETDMNTDTWGTLTDALMHTHTHKAKWYSEDWEEASQLCDSVVVPVKAPIPNTHTHMYIHPHCPSTNVPSLWQACQRAPPPQVGEGRKNEGKKTEGLLWERIFERANSERTKEERGGRSGRRILRMEKQDCVQNQGCMVGGLVEKHIAFVFLVFP